MMKKAKSLDRNQGSGKLLSSEMIELKMSKRRKKRKMRIDKKSIIAVFAFVILVASLMSSHINTAKTSSTTVATPSTALHVVPSTIAATPFEYFSVALNIENVTNLHGWQARLKWDHQILDFINVTEGDFLKSMGDTEQCFMLNQTEGWEFLAVFLYENYLGVSGSGTLANLLFRGTNTGECVLSLCDTKLFSSNPEIVSTPPNLGDANNDSEVNVIDIIITANAWQSYIYNYICNPNADFNADGVVDLFDFLCACFNHGCDYPPYPAPWQAYRPVEIPHAIELTDTDGDGLFDTWERDGIDVNSDGIIDLNLSALGADWKYKDLFVEVDYMGNATDPNPKHDHKPDVDAIKDVKNAFRNAPVNNPNGTKGIALHILEDEEILHDDIIRVWAGFDTTKEDYFGTPAQRNDSNSVNILAAKKMVYRYALFVHQWARRNGASWVPTNSSGIAEFPGNDFIVSLGSFRHEGTPDDQKGTRDEQAGTLMHELGHTLGLDHGGGDDINGKPNYLSIMSYSRQFSDWIPKRPLDYSRAKLPSLNESNLDENLGIQGPKGGRTVFSILDPTTGTNMSFVRATDQPIDWNNDSDTTDKGVAININYFEFGDNNLSMLEGYDDWVNLLYSFRGTAGFSDGAHPNVASQEITWEIVEQMRNETIIGFHDIASINTTPSKTVVGQNYCTNISVTLENQGYYIETFNITVYANETNIATFTNTTLTSGDSTTLTFSWNTTGFAKGNYTISAIADTVLGETDTEDNALSDGWVFVSIPGDLKGDKKVNILDAIILSNYFGQSPLSDPNADINNDGRVNILDCIILSNYFGKSWT